MHYLLRRRGFSLIEVLVVASIVVVLMGMMMPLLTMSKRASMRTASQAIMAKTEAALYQYKADFKGYPYQLTYTSDETPGPNFLGYHVGTDIATSDQIAVKADMAAASADYSFASNVPGTKQAFTSNRKNGSSSCDGNNDSEGDPYPSSSTEASTGKWYWIYCSGSTTFPAICTLLNRVGAERAGELMLIGDVTAGGVTMQSVNGPAGSGLVHHGRDMSAVPLVASPSSLERPGWAKDYLQGEIDQKYLDGTSILDAYRHPLIYICQVLPGIDPLQAACLGQGVDIPNPSVYGLQPQGRSTLEPFYPGTSTPIAGDPTTLPDVTNLMHSDMRYWAPPGYELEFELWSAGPDGQMSWWRDDLLNRDNIPCEAYNKGIGGMP